jgi:hypothetical protein
MMFAVVGVVVLDKCHGLKGALPTSPAWSSTAMLNGRLSHMLARWPTENRRRRFVPAFA